MGWNEQKTSLWNIIEYFSIQEPEFKLLSFVVIHALELTNKKTSDFVETFDLNLSRAEKWTFLRSIIAWVVNKNNHQKRKLEAYQILIFLDNNSLQISHDSKNLR